MSELSNRQFRNLRDLVDLPDLSGTKYEIVNKIAMGGMGTVYVAHDRELDRNVALKVLTVADTSGELVSRMLSEAKIVAQLEHPNIVPIHDVGILSDKRVFYVMKLVDGRTLAEIRGETSDLTNLLGIFQRICEGVAFAHTRGIIHRDLKPSNVMVGAFGEVLIMDWGLAIHSPADKAIGSAGNDAVGTPGYMSPEQTAGEAAIDHRADIYALGAILHFLLTGHHPTRERVSNVPRRLAAIAWKAMAQDRDERYHSALELRDDVSQYLAGEPVAAYQDRWWETGVRWTERNKFILLVVAVYVVVRFFIYFFGRP